MLDIFSKLFHPKSQPHKVGYSTHIGAFEERPCLQHLLPWRSINTKTGVVYGKKNDFFIIFEFRGSDLESATEAELVQYNEAINNVIKNLPTGYVLYLESQRHFASSYDKSKMPEGILQMFEDQRADYYNGKTHFENTYFFIIYYEPPAAIRSKITDAFIKDERNQHQDLENDLKIFFDEETAFLRQCNLIGNMLNHIFSDLILVDNPDMVLSYLHSTISNNRIHLKYNPNRYVCDYIVDSSFTGGHEPKLGNKHLRIVTVLDFPILSKPGLFDAFDKLDFEYRWVSRFICFSKADALKEMKNYQQQWSQQAKNLGTIIREAITREPSGDALNEEALMNTDDCTYAITELQSGACSYGAYTMTVIVSDKDERRANEKASKLLETINSLGFAGYIEKDNASEAWWGSLPGCWEANIRRPLISSKNFCHLAPITSTWSGDKRNKHLKGPVLLYTDTDGKTPFRLSLHVNDLGHTMVVGPSGAGKSVFLNTIEAHFTKYPNSKVFIFDKAASSRALTLALGGSFYNLASEGNNELSFQPLAKIDNEIEIKWAKEWILSYLRQRNMNITPMHDNLVWQALISLAEMPPEQRTMSNFVVVVQDADIRIALQPLTANGSYGKLFDNSRDFSGQGYWQVFEMETLMATPAIVPSTLDYLFHRIETSLKEASGPSIIVLDECWLFFDNPAFKDKLREYFKDMRKKNTSIIFATQNLADVINKPELLTTVMENCPNHIYLPNVNAINEQNQKLYKIFGCNEAQINLIAGMIPKSDYYYSSQNGHRIFRLALQESELPFVTATSKTDQQAMNKILSAITNVNGSYSPEAFIKEWFLYKGFSKQAEAYQAHYSQGDKNGGIS